MDEAADRLLVVGAQEDRSRDGHVLSDHPDRGHHRVAHRCLLTHRQQAECLLAPRHLCAHSQAQKRAQHGRTRTTNRRLTFEAELSFPTLRQWLEMLETRFLNWSFRATKSVSQFTYNAVKGWHIFVETLQCARLRHLNQRQSLLLLNESDEPLRHRSVSKLERLLPTLFDRLLLHPLFCLQQSETPVSRQDSKL